MSNISEQIINKKKMKLRSYSTVMIFFYIVAIESIKEIFSRLAYSGNMYRVVPGYGILNAQSIDELR